MSPKYFVMPKNIGLCTKFVSFKKTGPKDLVEEFFFLKKGWVQRNYCEKMLKPKNLGSNKF